MTGFWLIILLHIATASIATVACVRTTENAPHKTIWIAMIVLLPFIGLLLYVMLGRVRGDATPRPASLQSENPDGGAPAPSHEGPDELLSPQKVGE